MSDTTGKALEILVGLHVTDDAEYTRYRAGMTPILHRYGGSFRYDFRIAEVLKSDVPEAINRVFIIGFPDAETKQSFFTDEEYLAVKGEFFNSSVATTTIIAEYERAA